MSCPMPFSSIMHSTVTAQSANTTSSSAPGDEYDFEDDQSYCDELEHDLEPAQNESDEDTEEASETEIGRGEEPVEIKEQMYQDKLASLKKQLQQLKDGSHPEYMRKVRKLEYQYKERLRLNEIYREYLIDCVESDYRSEVEASAKDYEEKRSDLRENLLAEFDEKRRMIEAERFSLELTGDSMEVKPVMTRKLRRRPNDPIPVPEKRRKPPTAQLIYQLDEKEIESDVKIINRGKVMTPVRKQTIPPLNVSLPVQQPANDSSTVDTKVEDGKLWYERRWFHRGQAVFVEGRDMTRYAAIISTINSDAIFVKKAIDGSKVRICTTLLGRGKISIKRRAA